MEIINSSGGEYMEKNIDNNARKFRDSQRHTPYKIENSFSGSREYYGNGTIKDYRTIWNTKNR